MHPKEKQMKPFKGWHLQAIDLSNQGYSSRKISKLLGVGKSSVNDLLSKLNGTFYGWKEKGIGDIHQFEKKAGPRILIYDIETAPLIGQLWSLWQDGIGLNQLQQDWYIMSFAAKWLGEDEVFYFDQSDAWDMEDDKDLLVELWKLLDEADIVIG